ILDFRRFVLLQHSRHTATGCYSLRHRTSRRNSTVYDADVVRTLFSGRHRTRFLCLDGPTSGEESIPKNRRNMRWEDACED
ncbi:hypothetical protein AVEN_256282-1, partial [Araneus ventricosus]